MVTLRNGLLSVAGLLLAASCGAPVEGYALAVRFVGIDPWVVDRLVVSVRAEDGGAFEAAEERVLADGLVSRVEPDGTLTLDATWVFVRANAVTQDARSSVPIELRSEDPALFAQPRLFAVAYRGSDAIGEGSVYLPAWPPPAETCSDGGRTCPAEVSITCYSTARERCR